MMYENNAYGARWIDDKKCGSDVAQLHDTWGTSGGYMNRLTTVAKTDNCVDLVDENNRDKESTTKPLIENNVETSMC